MAHKTGPQLAADGLRTLARLIGLVAILFAFIEVSNAVVLRALTLDQRLAYCFLAGATIGTTMLWRWETLGAVVVLASISTYTITLLATSAPLAGWLVALFVVPPMLIFVAQVWCGFMPPECHK